MTTPKGDPLITQEQAWTAMAFVDRNISCLSSFFPHAIEVDHNETEGAYNKLVVGINLSMLSIGAVMGQLEQALQET